MSKKLQNFSIVLIILALIGSIVYFNFGSKIKNEITEKTESGTLVKLAKEIISGEKTFLVLFQNNMELRPGGGYIGSFAIIKTENGKIKSYEIHDTSNFDGRIPDNNSMPYPMKKVFRIDAWKLRDSNWSPDFPTNAKQALDFYYQGQGQENFDGVIAVNAAVLDKMLESTGSIELADYGKTFEAGTALVELEKQVEVDFYQQDVEVGDRKNVMSEFLDELLKKAAQLPKLDKLKLAKNLVGELDNKNIQLYFADEKLEQLADEADWSGKADQNWDGDYLLAVDANIGAYKSDYFIKRQMEYSVDMTGENPQAVLKITYTHTGVNKDWMTRDYLTYLRVYLPAGTHVNEFTDGDDVAYGEELGKKFIGGFVKVPLNSTKTIEIKYTLPQELKNKDYQLKIQKQSGSGEVPFTADVKLSNGEVKHFEEKLDGDEVLVD